MRSRTRSLVGVGCAVTLSFLMSSVGFAQGASHPDPHHLVRAVIHADTSIQAVHPPTVVYVWFRATSDGRVLQSGRDTSRVTLLQRARALGTIKTDGFAPAGVLAPARVVYAWVEVPTK
mgnify:FL=1